jgi:hypothetical protein
LRHARPAYFLLSENAAVCKSNAPSRSSRARQSLQHGSARSTRYSHSVSHTTTRYDIIPTPKMSGGENPNNDIVAGTLPDSISSISWSPKSNIFVATSWDNQVHWRNLALALVHSYARDAVDLLFIFCCAWPGALLGGERLGRRAQVVHVTPAAGSVLDVEQGRDARFHRRLRRRRQVLDPADRTGRRHRQGTHTHANNCTSRSPLGLQASTRQAVC